MAGIKCAECGENYHANKKKCPGCDEPNPRKAEASEEVELGVERDAPVLQGTAMVDEQGTQHDANTDKEQVPAKGPDLMDDEGLRGAHQAHLEEQREQARKEEELLKRDQKVRELEMEVAGLRVGNKETTPRDNAGLCGFCGSDEGNR